MARRTEPRETVGLVAHALAQRPWPASTAEARSHRTATVTNFDVATPPTDTDTAAVPEFTPAGILALIWSTPAGSSGASPAYRTSAACPPIVTVTGCTGVEYGVEMFRSPHISWGEMRPSPVP